MYFTITVISITALLLCCPWCFPPGKGDSWSCCSGGPCLSEAAGCLLSASSTPCPVLDFGAEALKVHGESSGSNKIQRSVKEHWLKTLTLGLVRLVRMVGTLSVKLWFVVNSQTEVFSTHTVKQYDSRWRERDCLWNNSNLHYKCYFWRQFVSEMLQSALWMRRTHISTHFLDLFTVS